MECGINAVYMFFMFFSKQIIITELMDVVIMQIFYTKISNNCSYSGYSMFLYCKGRSTPYDYRTVYNLYSGIWKSMLTT